MHFLFTSQQLKSDEIQPRLSVASIDTTVLSDHCLTEEGVTCPPLKYRNADSNCNNVQNPRWGSSYTSYGRLLNARYADGNSSLT